MALAGLESCTVHVCVGREDIHLSQNSFLFCVNMFTVYSLLKEPKYLQYFCNAI